MLRWIELFEVDVYLEQVGCGSLTFCLRYLYLV